MSFSKNLNHIKESTLSVERTIYLDGNSFLVDKNQIINTKQDKYKEVLEFN
ncbi:hypothetical protein [Campylobacter sp. US33a]|uniref:hypothetical protein n=1 Tax=Campylobacter sp. US33a TaxID=2498120 RepID=UPI0014199030|nr:hypothetical protein [Campylobacter sp. US33a]